MNTRSNSQDRVIREAMVQIFALQLRLGASIEEVLSAAQAAIRTASVNAAGARDEVADADVHQFGSVLRTWHRETRFLTRHGFPKRLPERGRNGIRSLVCVHYPKHQFDSVLHSLRQAGLIKRDKRGMWFPTTKYAVYPSLSRELLVHFSEGVARFIETMTRNVETQDKDDLLFDRSCKVLRLPISAGPAFRQFVNGQALGFLESVDDWLEGQAELGKASRKRKCAAGVFAFAFMDDHHKRDQKRRTESVAK